MFPAEGDWDRNMVCIVLMTYFPVYDMIHL